MSLLPYDTFLLHTSCHHHLFNMSIQPAVCTRELCVFSFYTLGVMSGAAEEVATGAEVWGRESCWGIGVLYGGESQQLHCLEVNLQKCFPM